MKTATIKADYIVKADLIKMLKIMIEQMEKGANVLIEVESNYGGKLKAEFTDIPLPDLIFTGGKFVPVYRFLRL